MTTSINLPPVPFTSSPLNSNNDLIPALHLRRWAIPGQKIVDIIGDSTGTAMAAAGTWVDPTQTLWGALQSEIVRRNPQCRFVFNNRAIGGTNWNNPQLTGQAMLDGGNSNVLTVGWFTNQLSKVWLDVVRDDFPDTLFILLGTNAPNAGIGAGSSVSLFINTVFTLINAWPKVPDIILVTNKVANPDAGPPYSTTQESYKAMAAFQRTFSRSNANGYTAFPNIKYTGLIDVGRLYMQRVLGKDYALQYLSKVPSAIQNNITMISPGTAIPLGSTTDGDLGISLLFHNGGGTAMVDALGGQGFQLLFGQFAGNLLHFFFTTTEWFIQYSLTGSQVDPVITSAKYVIPAGDVVVTVTLKGEVLRVLVNDTYFLDTVAPRLISGSDVTIGAALAPVGTITFDVTQFLDGVATPAFNMMDHSLAFGAVSGPTGGNDINHPSSRTIALTDYQAISAANLSAPPPSAQQLAADDGSAQIYANISTSANTATTNAEALKSAPIYGSQLFNVGDVLMIEAWGTMAATTDNKVVTLRFGGTTGLDGQTVASVGTVSASGLLWYLRGFVIKSALNVQLTGGIGTISSVNFQAFSFNFGWKEALAMYVIVESHNHTNAAAGSITCGGLLVSYLRAPGT